MDLSLSNVGPAVAESLATALKTNTNLTNLDFSSNDVSPSGAESLATALKTIPCNSGFSRPDASLRRERNH